MELPSISVVIPTMAEERRAEALKSAIASILNQEAVKVLPIVVVNGARFSPSLVDELSKMSTIQLHMEPTPGLVNAIVVGRSLVQTPFFSFLDDDDEYLPHALSCRVAPLLADNKLDAVVSNGFRYDGGVRSISARNLEDAKKDPFRALLENNWLTSCGGLYRTSVFSRDFFVDTPKYAEWTYLGFKLSLFHRLGFVNNPSYVINDTADSLSKSVNYSTAQVGILKKILDLPLPKAARLEVKKKYGAALHDLSDYYLEEKAVWQAFKYHWRSLWQPGGSRYWAYSRKFLGL